MLVTTKINKPNDKLDSKKKNKMTQLGLNIFDTFKFLIFLVFLNFENRKIKCGKIND